MLGGKRKGNSFSFLSNSLYIKHKKSGIKYTILKVIVKKKNKKPYIYAYRYYSPKKKNNKARKFFIEISPKNFSKYEPV